MNEFYEFSLQVFEEFPQLFIITTGIIFFCHYLIIKKQTYSFLDPLYMFVFFNSFAMVTVFFVSLFRNDVTIFIDLSLFNLLFFLPGVLIKPIKLNQFRSSLLSLRTQPEYIFFTLNAAIFIFSTIMVWAIKGIPIFSEDPSYAKVAIYQNGFGVIRYIHFVLPIYLTMYSFMDLILSEKKKTSISYIFSTLTLLFCFVFFVFSSAKTSILWALFSFALINEVFSNNRYYKIINIIKLILFIFSIGIVFLILLLSDTKVDNNAIERLFVLLGVRLLASGDALFFWYNFDLLEKMSSINILEYIFSPLMGMFGISSHEYSLGVIAMNVATGFPLGEFGPNAQLPLVLGLAFGPFRFFIAFFSGLLLFYLRNYTHVIIKKMGGGGAIIFTLLFFYSIYIYIDIIYFISLVYVFMLIPLPIYCIYNCIHFGFMKNRS